MHGCADAASVSQLLREVQAAAVVPGDLAAGVAEALVRGIRAAFALQQAAARR